MISRKMLPALSFVIVALLLLCSRALSAEIEFSYDPNSDLGPSHWGEIVTDNNQCDGQFNSPIAIPGFKRCDLKQEYIMNKGSCLLSSLNFTINNHGVESKYPIDGTCAPPTIQLPTVNGTYQAVGFHIHSGSEHSINNKYFDFELHIVHKLIIGDGSGPSNRTNMLAVVGIPLKRGRATNSQFGQLLKAWKAEYRNTLSSPACQAAQVTDNTGGSNRIGGTNNFDVYNLLESTDFAFYSGGLTTPPCTETVWWNMSTDPVIISDEQANQLLATILAFRDAASCQIATIADPITESTSRPIQPLNGRQVQLYCSSD